MCYNFEGFGHTKDRETYLSSVKGDHIPLSVAREMSTRLILISLLWFANGENILCLVTQWDY